MELIIYLLKVNIALLLFYCLYRTFFKKDTFFQWKRVLFAGIIFASLLYPFVDISGLFSSVSTSLNGFLISSEKLLEGTNNMFYSLQEVTISRGLVDKGASISPLSIILGVYLLGVIGLLVRFLMQLGSLLSFLSRSEKSNYKGHTIYIKKGVKTPFSFFHLIVLDPKQHDSKDLDEIISHETTHSHQLHSIDVFLSELFCIFCWFNPAGWLLKREIRMNLEYLADRSVIDSGFDSEHYQFHLLRLYHHKAAAQLSNNFNVSPLKERIIMMNKKESSLWSIVKYTLFIPLVLGLVAFSNCSGNKKESEEKVEERTIYSFVETPPSFPGGNGELIKWMQKNITYPVEAQEKGIEGRVIVRFVVEADGSVGDANLLRSLDSTCDKEALRIVKKMPKWTPGLQDGKPVAVYYTLPINFALAKSSSETEQKKDASK